jgi:hypothetical protein
MTEVKRSYFLMVYALRVLTSLMIINFNQLLYMLYIIFFFTKLSAYKTVTHVHHQNFKHGFDLNCSTLGVLPLAVMSKKIHSEIRLRLVFDARNAVTRNELHYILYYTEREKEKYAHSRFAVNYNKYLWYKLCGIRSIRG